MNSWIYVTCSVILILLFRVYFVIARKYSIVDLPNHRTMHKGATIRGGGIVISIAIIIFSLLSETPGWMFSFGMILIASVGFLDDVIDLSSKIRFPAQVVSILFILADLEMFHLNLACLALIVIVAAGILNAYNFMDGINGMTGGYSLIVLFSLVFVNINVQYFISTSFLIVAILAVLTFNIYNFRNKAVCFAGDVGSLSVAFVVVYLLIKLIFESQQLGYLLFLTLYGIDTVFTIVQRLANKENIFEAHRKHLFQVIVRETDMPHLYMSAIYMFIQALINFMVILILPMPLENQMIYFGIALVILSLIYIGLKKRFTSETV
ncbi:MAG: UDP-GlcNAc--UDP-phosphate GlcNAc-1-phosphate transferase [Cytophagales bacterium]|nr:UDP-GlcNAc--UDP-phosphate GlcNAc-1-phosphate transferase [Cytophagales bacterium]